MYVREGELRWSSDAAAAPAIATLPTPRSPIAPASALSLPRIVLHGVALHAIDERTCIGHILSELSAGRGGMVVTPNVDHLRRCGQDISFSALVAEADLVVADGMPLIWASRLQGTPLPQRVAGSDLISTLSAAAAGQGRSIFLLGGDPGTADAAAAILRDRYPQLKVAGTLCPPPGFEKNEAELQAIVATLQAARPDIIYVALGSPKQERLIDRIRRMVPATWWLGVGVSFSFLSGDVRRAPIWMRRSGLEWIHRLVQEPKRLFKRYILVGLPFAAALMVRAAAQGIPNRLAPRRSQARDDHALRQADAYAAANGQSASRRQEESESSLDRADADAHLTVSDPAARPATDNAPVFSETFRAPSPSPSRLRSLVLLGGTVRPTPLASAIGRSLLDLPVGNGKTVLARWLDEAAYVAQALGIDILPVRLLVDAAAPEPRGGASGRYRVERDTSEYRGTGGLLANIAVDYDDDDLILVGNAAQILLDPLPELLDSLTRTGGMISMIGHRDGTPNGLMLVTCRALRLIPKAGFVDMKEQALPIIASQYDVRVLQCRRPTALPIRSLSDYVATLRALHQPAGLPVTADPLAENWKSTFAIVEPGAAVAPSARIHDSVVLAGAAVEAGAVVVRSVVAGSVRKDRKAVDQCIASGRARSATEMKN